MSVHHVLLQVHHSDEHILLSLSREQISEETTNPSLTLCSLGDIVTNWRADRSRTCWGSTEAQCKPGPGDSGCPAPGRAGCCTLTSCALSEQPDVCQPHFWVSLPVFQKFQSSLMSKHRQNFSHFQCLIKLQTSYELLSISLSIFLYFYHSTSNTMIHAPLEWEIEG